MTDNESTGKRPRMARKAAEHQDEFMQFKSFKFYHRDSDEEGRERREDRKFGDKPRGGRRFDDKPRRRFDDDKPRGERRFDDRPRRRFDDNEDRGERRFRDRPRRRFDDNEDRGERRFSDRPRRRFDDNEDRGERRFRDRPRRRFDDNEDRGERRFSDRPHRRFDDNEDRGERRFSDRPRRRFDDDRPRSRRFDDNDRPRRRFEDDRRGGRRFDDSNSDRFNEDRDDEMPRRGRKGYVREKDPLYDRPKATGEIRLADCGICSRREADNLIKAGCVTVNGEVITEMGVKVKPEDKVVYGGQTLNREKLRYILLNKPKGYITTSDDPFERETVMELVKDACPERIFPVGRLDRTTTGLLLFTNDGDMAMKMTHPSTEIPKLYQVTLNKALTKNDMLRIAEGIELDDGPFAADAISYVEGDESKKEIGIELHSGRNRIVRRIFEHLGYEVEKLDRVMFAGLDKYKLPRGTWRFLTDQEVNNLKKI